MTGGTDSRAVVFMLVDALATVAVLIRSGVTTSPGHKHISWAVANAATDHIIAKSLTLWAIMVTLRGFSLI